MEADLLKKMGVSSEELEAVKDWQNNARSSEDIDEERTAWEQAKIGKFGASEAHRLMTYEDQLDTFPKGAETYTNEKVIEVLTGKKASTYKNADMEWGIESESRAKSEFVKRTGKELHGIGDVFILAESKGSYLEWDFEMSDHVGCTPDDLIGIDQGLEIKCPKSKTHLDYLLSIRDSASLKKAKGEYYWQCQHSMMVTGRTRWYFVSFDDRFEDEHLQMLIIPIDRNEEDIEKLRRRTNWAIGKKLEALRYLKETIVGQFPGSTTTGGTL